MVQHNDWLTNIVDNGKEKQPEKVNNLYGLCSVFNKIAMQ